VIFANPAARVRVGHFERRIPLPVGQDRLAAALTSGDPSTAAVAALMIFHGLRPAEVRDLKLTDVRDGRCYLPDRVVLLAGPVRTRLAAYLGYRHRR
jgi:integrase